MKRILITGIAQGFGKFLAIKFVKAGYIVSGIDRIPKESLHPELKNILEFYWEIDLNDTDNLPLSLNEVFHSFAPDILINNAALKFFKKFNEMSLEEIVSVSRINYIAPLILTKQWLNAANTGNQLTCIMMSSNAAYYGYAKGTLYCSSKSAIRLFAEALKEEFPPHKLQVITLCPETFKENAAITKQSDFSMGTVLYKMHDAIKSGKSVEIALLKPKTKLRYCFYEAKKFIQWFLRK